MTDEDLAQLLERTAERTAVGTPPISEMLDGASRLRQIKTGLRAAVVAAAVVAVVGGASLVTSPGSESTPSRPDAPVDSAPTPVPPGTRLVGIGSSAIAVPEDWATNAVRCRTPTRPTVVINVSVFNACLLLTPKVHDSVWIERGVSETAFTAATELEIDGVATERDETTCTEPETEGGIRTPRTCRGTVFIPSQNAAYRAEAGSPERVDEILSWITVNPDLVGVPTNEPENLVHQDDDAAEHYRSELAEHGFAVETVTEQRPGFEPGYILDVDPSPGTMLEPGDVVTVTEVAEPSGPADEVHVDVNSVGPGDSMDYRGRTDQQIRDGATIQLDLGGTIWVHGWGKRIGTLAGEVTGSSLVLDDWEEGPNYGRSWEAVERGTSTITVTITADGQRIEIGTVIVTVR